MQLVYVSYGAPLFTLFFIKPVVNLDITLVAVERIGNRASLNIFCNIRNAIAALFAVRSSSLFKRTADKVDQNKHGDDGGKHNESKPAADYAHPYENGNNLHRIENKHDYAGRKNVCKFVEVGRDAHQNFAVGARIVKVERKLLQMFICGVTYIVNHAVSHLGHIKLAEIAEYGVGYDR